MNDYRLYSVKRVTREYVSFLWTDATTFGKIVWCWVWLVFLGIAAIALLVDLTMKVPKQGD